MTPIEQESADAIRENFAEMRHVGARNGTDTSRVSAISSLSDIPAEQIRVVQGPLVYAWDFDGDVLPDSTDAWKTMTSAGQFIDPEDEGRTKAELADSMGFEEGASLKVLDVHGSERDWVDLGEDEKFLSRCVEIPEEGFGVLINGVIYTESEYLIEAIMSGKSRSTQPLADGISDSADLGTLHDSAVAREF